MTLLDGRRAWGAGAQSKAMRARLEKVEGKLNQLAQAAATSEAAAKKFEHLSTAESRVASELSNRAHDLELKLTVAPSSATLPNPTEHGHNGNRAQTRVFRSK